MSCNPKYKNTSNLLEVDNRTINVWCVTPFLNQIIEKRWSDCVLLLVLKCIAWFYWFFGPFHKRNSFHCRINRKNGFMAHSEQKLYTNNDDESNKKMLRNRRKVQSPCLLINNPWSSIVIVTISNEITSISKYFLESQRNSNNYDVSKVVFNTDIHNMVNDNEIQWQNKVKSVYSGLSLCLHITFRTSPAKILQIFILDEKTDLISLFTFYCRAHLSI